jgi:hypothetical protein
MNDNLIDALEFARRACAISTAERALAGAKAALREAELREDYAERALSEAREGFENYVGLFKSRASW